MARKTADLGAAKERKKKILAVGGAVLLVVMLAIQVPRTMKMLDSGEAQPPAEAQAADEESQTRTSPTPVPIPASTSFTVERDLASSGQLTSFGRFSRKDPFSPQIRADAEKGGSSKQGKSNAAGSKKAKSAKAKSGKAKSGKARKAPPNRAAQPGTPSEAARPTSAVLSINGVREDVNVGSAFPASAKVFRLVSLGENSARIGVAGGSLVGGADTVMLERGKTITLMNTADGARYALRLVSLG